MTDAPRAPGMGETSSATEPSASSLPFGTQGNLLAGLPRGAEPVERFETLLETGHLKIERIVSTGQSSPDGFWYDQAQAEWVLLMQGEATLRFEDEPSARHLVVGDWVEIAPHRRHRVDATSVEPAAVWLAVHRSG